MDRKFNLAQLAVNAGYFYGVDIERLLADMRLQPGCDHLQKRALQSYIYGAVRVPAHVALALSAVLGVSADEILRAVAK